jgi:chromosome segregation ATPase
MLNHLAAEQSEDTDGDRTRGDGGLAEATMAAALRMLIGRVTEPALAELEGLRVNINARCDALVAALVGTGSTESLLREVTDRLALAARQEAEAAARAARDQALQEAGSGRESERAETEKRLRANDAMSAELEEARAEVQRARAEAERAEQLAEARLASARAEFQTQKDLAAALRAVLMEALEEARIEVAAARASASAQTTPAHAAQTGRT